MMMQLGPNNSVTSLEGTPHDLGEGLERQVGEQIRELRLIKRLTLQQLADMVGISVGYLSQIERNRSKLPIGTLRKICDVLGIQVGWFFPSTPQGPAEERAFIVRARNRRRLTFTGLGIDEEMLSPNLSGALELLMSTIESGADSGEYSHEGSEAGVVICGTVELWVNGQYSSGRLAAAANGLMWLAYSAGVAAGGFIADRASVKVIGAFAFCGCVVSAGTFACVARPRSGTGDRRR